MKRCVFLAAMLISLSVYSQRPGKGTFEWGSKKEQMKANEVKLNLATTIFGSYPEISYERILDSDMSVGASVGVGLGEDYLSNFNLALMPYFRWFFGGSHAALQKYGAGFYLEANGAVYSQDYDAYEGGYDSVISNSGTGAGLGLAVGWKYLTKNNWVGDFYFGAGRDFVNDGAYPRMGISIGKRF